MKDDNVTAFQIFRQHYPKGMIASCGKEYMHMVRDCILEDYRTSVAANMQYQKHHRKEQSSFPSHIGNYCLQLKEYTQISLAEVPVIAYPWKIDRLVDTCRFIQKFHYDDRNHIVFYFREMKIAFVINGNHSIYRGIYLKEGKLPAQCYDDAYLFEHAEVDARGEHFISKNTKEILNNIQDPRLAMIFTISSELYEAGTKIKNRK